MDSASVFLTHVLALNSQLNRAQGPMTSQIACASLTNIRPMSEFLDFKRLSLPSSYAALMSRLHYNLAHFVVNYSVVAVILLVWCLLTNTRLLAAIALVALAIWGIEKSNRQLLHIHGRSITSHKIFTALLAIAVPFLLAAKVLPTLFWLIGVIAPSILGHAVLMNKPWNAHTTLFKMNTTVLASQRSTQYQKITFPSVQCQIRRKEVPFNPQPTSQFPATGGQQQRQQHYQQWQQERQQSVQLQLQKPKENEIDRSWGPYPILEDIAVKPPNFHEATPTKSKKRILSPKNFMRKSLRRVF